MKSALCSGALVVCCLASGAAAADGLQAGHTLENYARKVKEYEAMREQVVKRRSEQKPVVQASTAALLDVEVPTDDSPMSAGATSDDDMAGEGE